MEEEKKLPRLSGVQGKSEAWNSALARVQLLDYIPSSFTVCVRQLMLNSQEQVAGKPAGLDDDVQFLLNRFLRSPSIMAHVFFLTASLQPDYIANHSLISANDFIRLYGAAEWASIVALIFLTHTIKKKCDAQEWGQLSKILQEGVDVGAILGRRVSGLGLANGLLIPGIRYLSLGLCLAPDLKKFQNYRRQLVKDRRGFDLALEQKLWGCTHAQITALLLLSMGFPSWHAMQLEAALAAPPKEKIPQGINKLRILAYWSYALQTGANPPTIAGEDEFITSEVELDQVAMESKEVLAKGSPQSWLLKTAQDLTPEQAAQIEGFEEAKAMLKRRPARGHAPQALEQAEEGFAVKNEEIPEKMRRHFSDSEFKDLKSQIQSLLSSKAT